MELLLLGAKGALLPCDAPCDAGTGRTKQKFLSGLRAEKSLLSALLCGPGS